MKFAKVFISLLLIAAFTILLSSLFNISPLIICIVLTALSFTPRVQNSLNVVVSNPLIGKSKQSMGNATFSTWKGINVLKEKPQSVANPNSDSQQMQRSAFSQMVALFRQFPAAVRVGFKKLAVKKSEFNAFTSYNLKNAFDYSSPPTADIQLGSLYTSRGTIETTQLLLANADRSANNAVITWSQTPLQPGQSATDKAVIVMVHTLDKDAIGFVTNVDRSTETAFVDLPLAWNTGDEVWFYLAFYNPLSGESSDSSSFNTNIVA